MLLVACGATYRLERAGPVAGLDCERCLTVDRFGRQITFYLYSPAAANTAPLPLVVYIQGSSCRSLFGRHPDSGKVITVSGHSVLPQILAKRANLLVVEKPTVEFLDPGPGQSPPPEAYAREHTLERWSEAVAAAIRAACESPAVNARAVLVVGHSEGGQVASKVAHDLPGTVSHVAIAAGGGPTFLFDILSLARTGAYFGEVSDKPEERVQYVLDEWRKIEADPTSTEKQFFGHSWSRSCLSVSGPRAPRTRPSTRPRPTCCTRISSRAAGSRSTTVSRTRTTASPSRTRDARTAGPSCTVASWSGF